MKSKKWFYWYISNSFCPQSGRRRYRLGPIRGLRSGPRWRRSRGLCAIRSIPDHLSRIINGPGPEKSGQGRQQRLRDGSCVNNPNTQAPATTPAPAPSN